MPISKNNMNDKFGPQLNYDLDDISSGYFDTSHC